MIIRKLTLVAGAVAIVATLSLALSVAAGAASGYPGTTTVTTVPPTTVPGSTSPSGSTSPGQSAGPGDPCVVSPTSCATSIGIPQTGSTSSSGTLAFTGADLLALIVGALFLLAMGTLLVVFTRRRASHQPI